MTGTLINIAAILIGSTIGIVVGNRLQTKMQELVLQGVCMILLVLGINMINESGNILIPMVSIVIGAILGELMGIEEFVRRLGERIETRWSMQVKRGKVVWNAPRAFMTSSLVFCVGPMAVVGSIQEGLFGDYELLTLKGVMEGLIAIPIAACMGPGVLFSAGGCGHRAGRTCRAGENHRPFHDGGKRIQPGIAMGHGIDGHGRHHDPVRRVVVIGAEEDPGHQSGAGSHHCAVDRNAVREIRTCLVRRCP